MYLLDVEVALVVVDGGRVVEPLLVNVDVEAQKIHSNVLNKTETVLVEHCPQVAWH